MHNKKIEYKVIKLLSKNLKKRYSIKELSKILKIKKHHYKELVHTLYNLLKERKIELKDKKYYIPRRKQEEKFEKITTCTGIFDATALVNDKSYAFVKCPEYDVFVSIEDIKDSFHGDEVLVKIFQKKQGKKYGKILKVIKRKREKIVGTVFKYQSKVILIPDDKKIHKNFKITNKDLELKEDDKVVLEVIDWGSFENAGLPYGKVTEVLGKSGDPEVEILATIASLGLLIDFPEKVLKELKYISGEIDNQEIKNRVDLRHLTTFTIDPESAKDYDDAISLFDTGNGYILYVHIADVAHYIKTGSEIFKEAVRRGNSYYFPKKVIPMLPEKISNKICSLRPNEDKLTITVEIHLDKFYKIIKQKVYESVINSDARLTYTQVDDFFATGESDISDEIKSILIKMRKISRKLTEIRIKKGYLSFYLPESEYQFNENGKIIDIKASKETEAHKLIENFMLLANEFIAKKLSYHHTIYRIHELPDLKKIDTIRTLLLNYGVKTKFNKNLNKMLQNVLNSFPDFNYHIVFDRKILRSLKKAKYHIKNSGHFGLSIPIYTHFTSPIRRLCDLIIHHQIKDFLHKNKPKFDKKQLIEFAKQASEKEILADEGEAEIDIKYKQIFMREKLGEEFEGIITNISSTGIIIELFKYPIKGFVPLSSLKPDNYIFYPYSMTLIGEYSRRIYKLVQKVKVQLTKIDNDLIFKIIEDVNL